MQQLADKSFVSRRRSKFVGHTPRVRCLDCLLDPQARAIQVFPSPTPAARWGDGRRVCRQGSADSVSCETWATRPTALSTKDSAILSEGARAFAVITGTPIYEGYRKLLPSSVVPGRVVYRYIYHRYIPME